MITLQERETIAQRALRLLTGGVRADDYLPMTDEIRMAAARQLAFAKDWIQANVAPELLLAKQREELLIHYHGGDHIAYFEDANGIIVVAVGLYEISEVLRDIPAEDRRTLILTRPLTDSE